MCDQLQSDLQMVDHGKAEKDIHIVLWVQQYSCASLRCHLETLRRVDDISVRSLGGKHQKFFERRRHSQWQLAGLDPGFVEL